MPFNALFLNKIHMSYPQAKRAIATKIAQAIKDKGLTKAEFAQQMNVTPSVVSRWTKGTHNFTMRTISTIEAALGIKIIITDSTAVKQANPHQYIT